PLTPNAPRAARSHNVNCAPVPFLLIPVKVPLRGILKSNRQHRVTAGRKVTFEEEAKLQAVKIVSRWIGEPSTPDALRKKYDHVHVDPTPLLGQLRGWTAYGLDGGPTGQDSYIHGTTPLFQHAECGSPVCNKKKLHQYKGRVAYWSHCGGAVGLPASKQLEEPWNKPAGWTPEDFNREYSSRYPDIWMEAALER
ncbi:MAG: hypothetical protein Q9226_008649, partial [Calogaya cf. arnoldii]